MLKLLPALALAALCAWSASAHAGAADYAFELIKADLPKGDDAPILVRLINKKTGKPVEGATITRSRLDMAPEGMAEHAIGVKAAPSGEPGVYAFKADLSMEGRWQLSLAAKAPGEPETITGKLVFKVGP